MKIIAYVIMSAVLLVVSASGQEVTPGTVPMTPMVTDGLVRARITVPPVWRNAPGMQADRYVNIPEGWTATVFYAGSALSKPRFMAWGPDSVLYVANMNGQNVLALPDRDRDGVADTVVVAASGFSTGHDVRFWRDTMYVCQQSGVVAFQDADRNLRWEGRRTVIDRTVIPNWSGGRHGTRTLVIDSLNNAFYVSVGSNGNADREAESGKLQRAMIERFDVNGKNRRVYATGIRNAVGMTLHPRTGALWANNNGSDLQGDNIPPEWVDIVRDNGFYGYPFSYHYKNWFDLTNGDYRDILPMTAADTARFESMVPPAALLTAHTAPMAMEFAPTGFPSAYANGCFVALRGSWNRTPASGYKVVFLEFASDADTIADRVRDFCTGFMTDSIAKQAWARPVGLALHRDGSVYLSSDDLTTMILKLTPPRTVGVRDAGVGANSLRCTPNPTSGMVLVQWDDATSDDCRICVIDLNGRCMLSMTVAHGTMTSGGSSVDLSSLDPGLYVLQCTSGTHIASVPVHIVR